VLGSQLKVLQKQYAREIAAPNVALNISCRAIAAHLNKVVSNREPWGLEHTQKLWAVGRVLCTVSLRNKGEAMLQNGYVQAQLVGTIEDPDSSMLDQGTLQYRKADLSGDDWVNTKDFPYWIKNRAVFPGQEEGEEWEIDIPGDATAISIDCKYGGDNSSERQNGFIFDVEQSIGGKHSKERKAK
jgi:hypothetical protein